MSLMVPLRAISHNFHLLGKNNTFINSVRNYAFKTDLKIKWIHPGVASCISQEKSGDLDKMAVIPNNLLQLEYQNCKELEDADETVKKLFTLEYGPRRKTTQIYIKNVGNKVRRHCLDSGSAEAKIGRWTGCIHTFQESMEKFPRNKKQKVILKEIIDQRKKLLKRLRKWDYKRFEWVLDNLNIVYKPEPLGEKTFTRKSALVKLTDQYCDGIKNDRLNKYKMQLESEQPAFLEEKIKALEFIRKEQKECEADITVSQEEIDSVRKQLQELLIKRQESLPKEE